jgi:hypothetical protein
MSCLDISGWSSSHALRINVVWHEVMVVGEQFMAGCAEEGTLRKRLISDDMLQTDEDIPGCLLESSHCAR